MAKVLNLLEYFCRGNVFQTMTLLDSVKSRAMKKKSIAEPKSVSADKIQQKSQREKNHMNSVHVLAAGVIKTTLHVGF